MCTAAVTSYTGLIIARVFLGVAEAGFFPGCVYLMCFWQVQVSFTELHHADS